MDSSRECGCLYRRRVANPHRKDTTLSIVRLTVDLVGSYILEMVVKNEDTVRETKRHRKTDKQRDRQRDRKKDRKTEKETGK